MRPRSPSSAPYRGLPLPRTVRNLLANPGAFLAAVFGMAFMVLVKVLLVRGRSADR